jgi:hypothetical protein
MYQTHESNGHMDSVHTIRFYMALITMGAFFRSYFGD